VLYIGFNGFEAQTVKQGCNVPTLRIFNHHLRVPFLILAALEALMFILSVYGAALVRFQETEFEYTQIIVGYQGGDIGIIAIIYASVMMLCMIALGHYQSNQHDSQDFFAETIVRVMASLVLGFFALMVVFYLLPNIHIGRGFHLIALVLSFLGVVLIRTFFFQLIGRHIVKRKVLVIGAGSRAHTLITEKGGSQDGASYKIAGYVTIHNESVTVPQDKVLDMPAAEIADYALENEIDEIVLAIEDRRLSYPDEALLKCKLAGIKIIDPVCFLEREQGKVNLELLHPSWMIYSSGFSRNDFQAFAARSFDIVSSLIILVTMMPVMLLAAFLISLESGFKHSVFYSQNRVGLDGKSFSLLKFRSMKINAEVNGEAVWAKKNDDRITFFGKFIRKTRIDELPQILNILKGDMRLIGPRPERPEFVEDLATKIPYYKLRHTVKPGLAGWAQLKYPYGATERDAYEKLQYDLYYVKNQNLIMDFFILLQTVEIVIMGKGAR
jgi:sugar transferase (PEP-CTERM system associated)